jgi:hypothetical protein
MVREVPDPLSPRDGSAEIPKALWKYVEPSLDLLFEPAPLLFGLAFELFPVPSIRFQSMTHSVFRH